MQKQFVTDCVHSTANLISEMVDTAKEITYRTFSKYVDINEVSLNFGYALPFQRGLHLKNDYAVRFFKSKYKSKLCYFMQHSCIEYIYQ